jgi:hypothetical protein
MIPSIDYLTLVVSGSILLAGASNLMDDNNIPLGTVLALLGFFLFSVGTIRAFMSAFGL